MKPIAVFFGLLWASTALLRAEQPLDRNAVHQAVTKSIKWLETDMVTWRTEQGCSACHHGPMYLWSMHVAKRQGYSVNEPQLREMTEWLLTNDKARVFPKSTILAADLAKSSNAADQMTAAMMGHNNLSQPTLYLAHALNAMPADEPLKRLGWEKVVAHFASAQMDDGSFVGRKGWPPIFNSPQTHTLFAMTALTAAVQPQDNSISLVNQLSNSEELRKELARANAFLDQQIPDDSHQSAVLRLLRQTQSNHTSTSHDTRLARLIEELRQSQRADGGWSQTADRESDAFATGQTLYALRMSGLIAEDAAIRRGIEFLVRTQRDDGTWPMTSRPSPETGKPADFLNPITYAATAWATLGLSSHVPK